MTSSTPTSQRATIIHGYNATAADHWFPWLAERLRERGIPTNVPSLPNPGEPDRAEWEAAVAAEVAPVDAGTVIVAHSLGCLTVLRYLASLPKPWRLGTLVLVAGFAEPLPALPVLADFVGDGMDVSEVAQHVDRLVVLRSDNDAFVPAELTDRLAEQFGVSAQVITGAGHFLAAEGIDTLPAALEAITGR